MDIMNSGNQDKLPSQNSLKTVSEEDDNLDTSNFCLDKIDDKDLCQMLSIENSDYDDHEEKKVDK